MGTDKHSIATKKQWAKLSKKKRAERMKPLKEARWKNISAKKRSEHARMMALARHKKDAIS